MKIKSFKYKIFPNEEQKILISKHFWASRFVWNYFLNERKEYYLKNKEDIEAKRIKWWLNYYDNAKELTLLKKKEWFEWLSETNSQTLQATLKYLKEIGVLVFHKIYLLLIEDYLYQNLKI